MGIGYDLAITKWRLLEVGGDELVVGGDELEVGGDELEVGGGELSLCSRIFCLHISCVAEVVGSSGWEGLNLGVVESCRWNRHVSILLAEGTMD